MVHQKGENEEPFTAWTGHILHSWHMWIDFGNEIEIEIEWDCSRAYKHIFSAIPSQLVVFFDAHEHNPNTINTKSVKISSEYFCGGVFGYLKVTFLSPLKCRWNNLSAEVHLDELFLLFHEIRTYQQFVRPFLFTKSQRNIHILYSRGTYKSLCSRWLVSLSVWMKWCERIKDSSYASFLWCTVVCAVVCVCLLWITVYRLQ